MKSKGDLKTIMSLKGTQLKILSMITIYLIKRGVCYYRFRYQSMWQPGDGGDEQSWEFWWNTFLHCQDSVMALLSNIDPREHGGFWHPNMTRRWYFSNDFSVSESIGSAHALPLFRASHWLVCMFLYLQKCSKDVVKNDKRYLEMCIYYSDQDMGNIFFLLK